MGFPDVSTSVESPFYTPISNPINFNDLNILYTNADQFLNKRNDLNM